MAYTEQRGQYWRGRYKLPRRQGERQKYGTVSEDEFGFPFSEDTAAYEAALVAEVEARRAGPNWRDPRKGDIPLRDWVKRWWTAQDLEDTTVLRCEYLIDVHILPEFGDRSLNNLDREQVAAWELRIPAMPKRVGRGTYSRRTARDARDMLATLLGDAVTSRLIEVNVAERQRHRGKKSNRVTRRTVSEEKVWATPLQSLLIAERASMLSGRPDEFVLVTLIGWMGQRWGEASGFDVPQLKRGWIDLKWQLKEVGGRFYKAPPKDNSKRRQDTPPFLSDLLAGQVQRSAGMECRCPPEQPCGGGPYLFLSPNGSHLARSSFSEFVWHPAVDGATPATGGKQSRPQMPVLVDGGTGVFLRPAWPYADVENVDALFVPPRGGGRTRWDGPYVLGVPCPVCRADAGQGCRSAAGKKVPHHRGRIALAEELGVSLAPVSWVPVLPGLTPHGLRHSHQTWMREAKVIDPKLMAERMGHEGGSSMQEHYTHISSQMRETLLDFLEVLWEQTVRERIALDVLNGRVPGSPVGALDEIIQAHVRASLQAELSMIISRDSPSKQDRTLR